MPHPCEIRAPFLLSSLSTTSHSPLQPHHSIKAFNRISQVLRPSITPSSYFPPQSFSTLEPQSSTDFRYQLGTATMSNTSAQLCSDTQADYVASKKALRVTAHQTGSALGYGTLWNPLVEPNVVRYAAPSSPPIADQHLQDQVVKAVKSQVQGLLLDSTQQRKPANDFKLAVVFHQIFVASQPSAIIDIICDSAQTSLAVRSALHHLQVGNGHNRVTSYTACRASGGPSQRLLPVYLSVPDLRAKEVDSFQEALQVMAAPIGCLPYPLRVAVVARAQVNETALERVVVAWIKLSAISLDLNYPKLQARRASSFEWEGAMGTQVVKIEYQDRHLASYQQYVAEHEPIASPSSPLLAPQSHVSTTRVKKEEPASPIKEEELETSIKKEEGESPLKKRKQGGT